MAVEKTGNQGGKVGNLTKGEKLVLVHRRSHRTSAISSSGSTWQLSDCVHREVQATITIEQQRV
jgi:hypothetical protein